MSFKKCKVVLLPTNNEVPITFVKHPEKEMLQIPAAGGEYRRLLNYGYIPYNLYFINDDEITKEDWVLDNRNQIWKADSSSTILEGDKKIVATTDTNLKIINIPIGFKSGVGALSHSTQINLPQPSKSFIEKFIEMYNKNTPIKSCMIEYENIEYGHVDNFNEPHGFTDILKVNSKNEITIKRYKESWSKEEVDDLLDRNTAEVTNQILQKYKDYKSKKDVELLLKTLDKHVKTYNFYFEGVDNFIKQNL